MRIWCEVILILVFSSSVLSQNDNKKEVYGAESEDFYFEEDINDARESGGLSKTLGGFGPTPGFESDDIFKEEKNVEDPELTVSKTEEMSDDLTDEEWEEKFRQTIPRRISAFPSAEIITAAVNSLKDNSTNETMCGGTMTEDAQFFRLNSTNGKCIYNIVAPVGMKVYLECSNINMKNCTHLKSDEYIVMSLLGRQDFNYNSYYWCGKQYQIRGLSLKNKLVLMSNIKSKQLKKGHLCGYKFIHPDGVEVKQCGRSGRIIGGKPSSVIRYPWVAHLEIHRSDDTSTTCTGTIIDPQWVLTAAHCIRRAVKVVAFMGGHSRTVLRGQEMLIEGDRYILHPRWNPTTLNGDLGLLHLTMPITYNSYIAPVCLPSGRVRRRQFIGTKVTATGWGRISTNGPATKVLMETKIPVMKFDDCKNTYKRYFKRTMICVNSTEKTAICYGDSGGPLLYSDQQKTYQIGIASFSLSKSCGNSPDVFTRVGSYYWWIRRKINADKGWIALLFGR